jgi:hypothetical protein
MSAIWEQGLKLANGASYQALRICTESVNSSRSSGESESEYKARLDGIPAHVFGTSEPNAGVDKPQHFYAAASLAYEASMGSMDYDPVTGWSPPMTGVGEFYAEIAGRIYEVKDWIKGLISRTGGYDEGDIFADDRGAGFGEALAGRLTDLSRTDLSPSRVEISDHLYGIDRSSDPSCDALGMARADANYQDKFGNATYSDPFTPGDLQSGPGAPMNVPYSDPFTPGDLQSGPGAPMNAPYSDPFTPGDLPYSDPLNPGNLQRGPGAPMNPPDFSVPGSPILPMPNPWHIHWSWEGPDSTKGPR